MSYNLPSKITVEGTDHTLDGIINDLNKWNPKYNEFAQGRTNFQIEKFIALEDGTLTHSYVNTLYQTRVMRGELLREVKRGIETVRNFEYRWDKNDPSLPIVLKDDHGNERLIWYDLEKLEHDHNIAELKMSIKDKVQQLETFDAILAKLEEMNGKPFTKKQYDEEAPLYWEKRFERQVIDDIISTTTGINTGNTKSIRQAAAPSILENSPNQISKDAFVSKLIDGNFDRQEAIKIGNDSIRKLYDQFSAMTAIENKAPEQIENPSTNIPKKDRYSLDDNTLKNLGIKKV